jgi:ferritin-like metal-binding protein YciE
MEKKALQQEEDVSLYFSNTLRRMYWAEKNIVLLLDKLRTEAFASELKNTIEMHLTQTQHHIQRIEQIFNELGLQPEDHVCEALKGLLNDAGVTLHDTKRKTRTRDIGITASLLKVTHYEMATYSILIQVAHLMGWSKIAELLEQILREEKDTDEKLNPLRPS